MMRRLTLTCVCAMLLGLGPVACASTGSHALSCGSAGISPTEQPGRTTAHSALVWYTSHLAKTAGLPTSGYKLESHDRTRYVYTSGRARIALSLLPSGGAKSPRVWVVSQTFTCKA